MITAPPETGKSEFWNSFCSALETEPREHKQVQGASGITHQVQAIGVDDARKRVVLVSAEHDPRIAALMQNDVQASMPDVKVVVARPISFDIASAARVLFALVNQGEIGIAQLTDALSGKDGKPPTAQRASLEDLIAAIGLSYTKASIPALSNVVNFVQQLAHLDWDTLIQSSQADPNNPTLRLEPLLNLDNLRNDLRFGVCPVPLYDFRRDEWETFASGNKTDEIRSTLERLNIRQYFFPPADQLILGVLERGINTDQRLLATAELAPKIGHPLGENEILNARDLPEVLAGLRELGYVAEGEHGLEISEQGRSVRSVIRFRPRESLFSKLLSRFNVNVNADFKDLL